MPGKPIARKLGSVAMRLYTPDSNELARLLTAALEAAEGAAR
ncbi:MAG: hypothetical protein Q8N23_13360 [Archangium sp.]|nr:hypothetical protein [Archangium sp.]MDP3153660.1 hypothetical protein [Archangium sp.]MDP3569292.1 hypothetical protein [Archangium sp.]